MERASLPRIELPQLMGYEWPCTQSYLLGRFVCRQELHVFFFPPPCPEPCQHCVSPSRRPVSPTLVGWCCCSVFATSCGFGVCYNNRCGCRNATPTIIRATSCWLCCTSSWLACGGSTKPRFCNTTEPFSPGWDSLGFRISLPYAESSNG